MSKHDLIPYKKGQSGNPSGLPGRPKGSRNMSTIIRELMMKQVPSFIKDDKKLAQFAEDNNLTFAKAVVLRLYYNAIILGDAKAIEQLLERTEGKVKQFHDVTSDGLPISNNHTVVFKDFTKEEDEK